MNGGYRCLVVGVALLVSACSPAVGSASPTAPPAAVPPTPAAVPAGEDPFAPTDAKVRTDKQGAIVVEVTPLSLDRAAEAIVFEVALNTHSIDLNMDLESLATLETDSGLSVPAQSWDGASGGHHVRGRLMFPAVFGDARVLDGAGRVTLEIRDLDAALRTFEWDLP